MKYYNAMGTEVTDYVQELERKVQSLTLTEPQTVICGSPTDVPERNPNFEIPVINVGSLKEPIAEETVEKKHLRRKRKVANPQ